MAILENSRHEKFAQNIAKGMSQRKAYYDAFPNSKKWKPETVDNKASFLCKTSEILTRCRELSEEIKNESIADIQEMQSILTQIIRQELEEEVIVVEGCGDGVSEAVTKKKKSNIKDIVSAINTLGKMQGAFVTNVNVEGTIPVVIMGEEGLEE